MPERVIIDTDILIDAGRAVKEAMSCLYQVEKKASLAISVVSQMELLVGCRSKDELHSLEKFLLRFQILELNPQLSDLSVDLLRRYRLSHGLLIADALIAATALSLDLPFVTKNQSDYRFISGLRLLPYPQPFTTER